MVAVLVFASTFAGYLPVLGFVWLIWWLDRYDREPRSLIILCFLWGALGATTIAGTLNSLTMAILGLQLDGFVLPVLVAPLTEEPFKALILLFLVRLKPFDNITDGFVYGATAGLGFAAGENVSYFRMAAEQGDVGLWSSTVFVRTFWTAMVHASTTSIIGAALGSMRYHPKANPMRARNALVVAMLIHSLWNLHAVSNSSLLNILGFFGIPALILILFLVLQVCLWREHKAIHAQLLDEAAHGILPSAHVAHLASWLRRDWGDWVPEGVDRKEYIRLATRLSFRKHQATTDPENDFLKKEIRRLRAALKVLLAVQPATRA